MRYLLLCIICCAFSPRLAHSQQAGIDSLQEGAKPTEQGIKQHQISKSQNEKATRAIFAGLNNVLERLEVLNGAVQSAVIDTISYPVSTNEKPKKVIIRLRIVGIDSTSRTPFECNLIIDSLGYSTVYLKKIKNSNKYVDASLNANSKELLIKLGKFNNSDSLRGTPVSTADTSGTSLSRNGLYIVLALAGLLLSSWIAYQLYSFWALKKSLRDEKNETPVNVDFAQPSVAAELPQAQFMPPVLSASNLECQRYFLSEIMITAGPRKKNISEANADKDLGEDVCGFVSKGNMLMLWLLDGTSDQYCLKNPNTEREYFSSRLLAQSIANKIRSYADNSADEDFDELMKQAIAAVRIEWLNVINELPLDEKNVLTVNITNRNVPECSTTLFVGKVFIDGKIVVYRSGDSKVFLYETTSDGASKYIQTSLSEKNVKSNDRLFFRLVLNANGEIDLVFNSPRYEVVQHENIHSLVVVSDGVGSESEIFLKQDHGKPLHDLRSDLMYQVQGTADDKCICFVEIKDKSTQSV